MCFLNLGQWAEALQAADKGLEFDPQNVKTLFRKAKAMAGSKDYLPSLTVLKQAEKLDPNNKEITQYIEKVIKLHETLKQKQTKAFKNMFASDEEKKESTQQQ